MTRKKLSEACPHVNEEKKVLQSNSINESIDIENTHE
jgi:hypothetical protein